MSPGVELRLGVESSSKNVELEEMMAEFDETKDCGTALPKTRFHLFIVFSKSQLSETLSYFGDCGYGIKTRDHHAYLSSPRSCRRSFAECSAVSTAHKEPDADRLEGFESAS